VKLSAETVDGLLRQIERRRDGRGIVKRATSPSCLAAMIGPFETRSGKGLLQERRRREMRTNEKVRARIELVAEAEP
jgi:hypothetical protein